MEEKKLHLEVFSIDIEKDENTLSMELEKLGSGIEIVDELRPANVNSTMLVPTTISELEDDYHFEFYISEALIPFETIKTDSRYVRLKSARNMCSLSGLSNFDILPIAHPECIFFDDNYLPKSTIRYIKGMKKYEDIEKNSFFDLKMLILSILYPKYKWEEIYQTAGKVIKEKDYLAVREAETIEEVETNLTMELCSELDNNKNAMTSVPKKKYFQMKITSIVAPILVVALILPLVFYTFFDIPFKNKVINGATYFLANDYSNVVSNYTNVNISNIPLSGKYQLACSYIQLSGLNSSQKEIILKNLSVRSVEDYLDYWIYYGRNEFEDAHETAKTLQDLELKYFAVIGGLDYFHNYSDLKGTAKEEKINEYNALKDGYERELEAIRESNQQPEETINDTLSDSGGETDE